MAFLEKYHKPNSTRRLVQVSIFLSLEFLPIGCLEIRLSITLFLHDVVPFSSPSSSCCLHVHSFKIYKKILCLLMAYKNTRKDKIAKGKHRDDKPPFFLTNPTKNLHIHF